MKIKVSRNIAKSGLETLKKFHESFEVKYFVSIQHTVNTW